MLRCRLFLFFCSNSLEKNGAGRWELGWSRWAKRGTEEKTETTTRCWGHPTRPHGGAHPARAVPSGTRHRAQALHVPLLLRSQTPAQRPSTAQNCPQGRTTRSSPTGSGKRHDRRLDSAHKSCGCQRDFVWLHLDIQPRSRIQHLNITWNRHQDFI